MPEYDIGYKKPPMKSRFKRGVSGNPKGRPKHKPLVLADIIRRVSTGRAMYHEKGRVKRVTRLELFIKTIVDRAMKGDITSAEHVLKFRAHAQRFGDAGIDRLKITDWLPDYPGQTADEKTRDFAATGKADATDWWREPAKDSKSKPS
jgi:Family of unknown function (DUF5681)